MLSSSYDLHSFEILFITVTVLGLSRFGKGALARGFNKVLFISITDVL